MFLVKCDVFMLCNTWIYNNSGQESETAELLGSRQDTVSTYAAAIEHMLERLRYVSGCIWSALSIHIMMRIFSCYIIIMIKAIWV